VASLSSVLQMLYVGRQTVSRRLVWPGLFLLLSQPYCKLSFSLGWQITCCDMHSRGPTSQPLLCPDERAVVGHSGEETSSLGVSPRRHRKSQRQACTLSRGLVVPPLLAREGSSVTTPLPHRGPHLRKNDRPEVFQGCSGSLCIKGVRSYPLVGSLCHGDGRCRSRALPCGNRPSR
jgi:hypothetical protein